MNKKIICLMITVALLICAVLSSCASSDDVPPVINTDGDFSPAVAVSHINNVTEEVRGVWIASVYNINFPSSPDLSEKELKRELENIVDKVLSYNMNTVFFQVHPASDALYRSDIFPVSQYLYSDGILHFDPLEYMVKLCREKDIALYAWINPLRVSVISSETEEDAIEVLPKGSPGKDNDLTVFYGDGRLYLDCGVKAVRDLVCETVKEITLSYDVDGIVFDDYFYPYPVNDDNGNPYVFNDTGSYAASGSTLPIDDWRRENVNQMIKQCYTEIKSIDPDIQFGVAPFGIWRNNDGVNGGSATNGMEAYSELYCDAVSWIKGKYIDFISPQLYWKCDSASAPFNELISFWSKIADGTGVDVIVSHGVYQYETWDSPEGELNMQIELARDHISYKGSMLYGYQALLDNESGLADDTAQAFGNHVYYYHSDEYTDKILLSVSDNVIIDGNTVIFDGYSDPNHPLSVNGTVVNRSHGGYFKCELALAKGENAFEFKCGDYGKTITVISRN